MRFPALACLLAPAHTCAKAGGPPAPSRQSGSLLYGCFGAVALLAAAVEAGALPAGLTAEPRLQPSKCLCLTPALACPTYCSYPYNLDFDYGPLEGLQKYCINNLGDPFIE